MVADIKHLPETFGFRFPEAEVFPQMVVCAISLVCNATCVHCPNAATGFSASLTGKDRLMKWHIMKKVADECAQYPHNLIRVSSFGEVLLHPEAMEMMEYMLTVKKDKNVALTTNGSLLTPENSLRLLKAGIESVEISVDAADAETYSKIRLGLDFEETLENIEALVRLRDDGGYRAKIMVSVIEQDLNCDKLDNVIAFWESIVDKVLVRKLLSFKGVINRTKKYESYMPQDTPCPFLWERVAVDPAGDVRGCVSDLYNTSKMGNILEKSLSEIWRGEPVSSWRKMHLAGDIEGPPMCKGCSDLEYRSWNYNYFEALKNT